MGNYFGPVQIAVYAKHTQCVSSSKDSQQFDTNTGILYTGALNTVD